MRLSDLLGAEVLDEAGGSAGRVHDVRLVQDGPVLVASAPACGWTGCSSAGVPWAPGWATTGAR